MSDPTAAAPRPKAPQGTPLLHVPGPRPLVWAPSARTVDLLLPPRGAGTFEDPGTQRSVMRLIGLQAPGWWGADHELPEGTDYGFSVDGGPGMPDPRSPRQPYGVEGPSRTFDPAFAWTDDRWHGRKVAGGIVYVLHVGTFTPEGTLDAAARHLEHVASLGASVVELLPVTSYPGGAGLRSDDELPYAVHEPYGGPRALQRFVDAAHAHGLAVALAVPCVPGPLARERLPRFGPYLRTPRPRLRGSGGPGGGAGAARLRLDGAGSREVREWVLDVAERWFREFHVDVLRLDQVYALRDRSPTHLLTEATRRVGALSEEIGRDLALVAERAPGSGNGPRAVGPQDVRVGVAGTLRDVVHDLLTSMTPSADPAARGPAPDDEGLDLGPVELLRRTLTGVRAQGGRRADAPPVARYAGVRTTLVQLVTGDGATGTAGAAGAHGEGRTGWFDALALAAALSLTCPATPLVFMGEEWGAVPTWADLVAATAAHPGGHGALDRGQASHGGHARLLSWYRTLTRLRRDPALGPGSATQVHGRDGEQVLLVERGPFVVAANLGHLPRTVPLPAGAPADARVVAAWDPATSADARGVHLPARCAAVLALS